MKIENIEDLKKAFGTYTEASRVLGLSTQHMHICKVKTGHLPMGRYFIHKAILAELGHTAPKTLWGFKMPEAEDTV